MIHVLANALTTRVCVFSRCLTVLLSFTLCRTSSLLILSTQVIFYTLLQIHISMACNLFLSAWVIVHVCDVYNTTLHNTLFTILFFNSILKLPVISFFLFINACLPSAVLCRTSVPQYPSAEITLPKYLNWSTYSTCWPSILILTFWFPWREIHDLCLFMVALWNRADHYIFMLWFVLLLLFFLA